MIAIRTEHLGRTFPPPGGRHSEPILAVNDLTLSVAEGEIFGLVGPDGAGKTTTMRLLASILTPTAGQAWVNDLDVVRQADAVKEQIGYVSQRFGLYPDLTVIENIHFYADVYGVPGRGRTEKIDRLLDFADLAPFKRRLAGNLSGGMKQKLGLICALIHTPRVLLLDEPTNGVDPVSRRDFWRILNQLLAQHVTIFLATAYLDEAERCNHVGLIHSGRLLACGTPTELKRLVETRIVAIQTPSPRTTFAAMRDLFGHDNANLFGARVHVYSRQPDQDTARARSTLQKQGLADADIHIAQASPSLEDVFVSVLSGEGAK